MLTFARVNYERQKHNKQVPPGTYLFFQGVIHTITLHYRRALYKLSYKSTSAERGLNLQHNTTQRQKGHGTLYMCQQLVSEVDRQGKANSQIAIPRIALFSQEIYNKTQHTGSVQRASTLDEHALGTIQLMQE